MDSKTILKELQSHGWEFERSRGSHHIFRHPKDGRIAVVPHPKRDLPIGTVKALERATGLRLLK
jgi:predicted RNA binding protein YcfA (HicA-like mRNA interferase family)